MKIHTDSLEWRHLYMALGNIGAVPICGEFVERGSRSRARAFDARLYVIDQDALHRRRPNNNHAPNGREVFAATWDEWGVWIARLFALDPTADIGPYGSLADLVSQTRKYRDYVRANKKPDSLEYRTHTAPWIEAADAASAAASAERVALRERIAVAIARERYASDNVEVFGVGLVESYDGGYWIASRHWVDADDVEARLSAEEDSDAEAARADAWYGYHYCGEASPLTLA